MGKGTGGKDESDDPTLHPQVNEFCKSVGKKICMGSGYPERKTVQMSWVLYACGSCRRTSKTQEVCRAHISKVEEIQYDSLVAGFSPECAYSLLWDIIYY